MARLRSRPLPDGRPYPAKGHGPGQLPSAPCVTQLPLGGPDADAGDKKRRPKRPVPFPLVVCAVVSALALSVVALFGAYHAASGNPIPVQKTQRIHRRLPSDSIYKLTATDIDGKRVSLSQYAGMATMVVNVASE
uniref:Glutathione peroxidase n=1 Tax=Trieres chinensis TaxID=1514140 RepID=A0A7S2EWM6_TRICV